MGLHSRCGYPGGCIGPLGVGFGPDLLGNDSGRGWGRALGHIALFRLIGLAVLRRVGRGKPEANACRGGLIIRFARRLATTMRWPPRQ
jgi:hypothetical protein